MFGKFNQNLVSEEYEPPVFGQIDQEKSRTKQIQEQRDRKELLFDFFILDFAENICNVKAFLLKYWVFAQHCL